MKQIDKGILENSATQFFQGQALRKSFTSTSFVNVTSSAVLIKVNPLLDISDTDNIVQVWTENKSVLK